MVFVALLAGATLAALSYWVPTLAGLARRRLRPCAPVLRVAVLVPAHNEEHSLPATLRNLAQLDYPRELLRVCVIADNCSDNTAAVAVASGADCVTRTDAANRGKGYALAYGFARVLAESPDVIVVLDADCELNANAIHAFAALFADGALAVQAAVRSANADDGPGGLVAAVGAAFDDTTAAGWDRLGLAVPLRGTGMAFHRDTLTRVPWQSFGLAEDAQYAAQLKLAGIRVRYCGEAVVTCAAPQSVAELYRQRRRWRAAGILSSKPLVLGFATLAVACGFATGFAVWSCGIACAFAALYLRAICAIGVTRTRLKLLLRTPVVVSRLAWVALEGIVKRTSSWERTARATTPGRTP